MPAKGDDGKVRRRPGCISSKLYRPPHLFPCLRFALHLAVRDAKLGAERIATPSCLVRILHSLLHVGLSRRTAMAILRQQSEFKR